MCHQVLQQKFQCEINSFKVASVLLLSNHGCGSG